MSYETIIPGKIFQKTKMHGLITKIHSNLKYGKRAKLTYNGHKEHIINKCNKGRKNLTLILSKFSLQPYVRVSRKLTTRTDQKLLLF